MTKSPEWTTDLDAITERLERVMPKEYVAVWLRKPIEGLGFQKPLDLIAAGEYRPVERIVASIEEPGAV